MRHVKENDLKGKTVTSVDTKCGNVVHLTFADGTELSLWAEPYYTPAGSLAGIFIYDDKDEGIDPATEEA